MGQKLFVAVLEGSESRDETLVTQVLGQFDWVPVGEYATFDVGEDTINLLVNRNEDVILVGQCEGHTVVHWERGVWDALTAETPAPLEEHLLRVFPTRTMCLFGQWDVSNFYGYSLLKDGVRVRRKAGSLEGLCCNDGTPLTIEAHEYEPTDGAEIDGAPPLVDKDGEPWSHHQVGASIGTDLVQEQLGFFVGRVDCITWTIYHPVEGAQAFADDLKKRREQTLVRRAEYERDARLALFENDDFEELAVLLRQPAVQLRAAFITALERRVRQALGPGYETSVQPHEGKLAVLLFVRAYRLWSSNEKHELPLDDVRILYSSAVKGEEYGSPILPASIAAFPEVAGVQPYCRYAELKESGELQAAWDGAIDECGGRPLRSLAFELHPHG